MSTQPQTLFTPQQYLEMERKTETRNQYLNGEIFAMSGASLRHTRIANSICFRLTNQLRDRDCEAFPLALRLRVNPGRDYLYTYPDLSVVCGKPELEDEHFDTLLNPKILIEILSPSTEPFDRGKKFALYRQLKTLAEYILVSQDRPQVEQYVRGDDGTWTLTEQTSMDASIVLPSVGATLKLAEIYHNVEFDAVP